MAVFYIHNISYQHFKVKSTILISFSLNLNIQLVELPLVLQDQYTTDVESSQKC